MRSGDGALAEAEEPMLYSSCATARVNVSAAVAFDFMADPIALGTWALGCMNVDRPADGAPFRGTSMFDGSHLYFEIVPHRALLLLDYRVGTPGDLKPRICARIVPGEVCGLSAEQCYVSLIAWRSSDMSEERWQRLCDSHRAEIWLIKSKLESAAAGQSPRS